MVYDRDPTLRGGRPPGSGSTEGSGVELEGTVGDPVSSEAFKFKSAADSNVVVEVKDEGGGRPRIEIGVYYV